MVMSHEAKEEVASDTPMESRLAHMSILQQCYNTGALNASVISLQLINNLSRWKLKSDK